jgi:hypothetical protein
MIRRCVQFCLVSSLSVGLLLGPVLIAQQVLNNEGVLKLVKAGLSEDLIVTTIKASPGQYDTSASGLVALKDGGASEKIISTIVSKSAVPSGDAPPSLSARPAAETSESGTVHIYRYKQYVGSALHPSIYCDETRLARISSGRYLDIKVSAGDHVFYADDKQAGAVVKVEPGKEYYFRTDLQEGFWKGHFRLNMVQPEQGKYDVEKLKPLEDKEAVTDLTKPAAAK